VLGYVIFHFCAAGRDPHPPLAIAYAEPEREMIMMKADELIYGRPAAERDG